MATGASRVRTAAVCCSSQCCEELCGKMINREKVSFLVSPLSPSSYEALDSDEEKESGDESEHSGVIQF